MTTSRIHPSAVVDPAAQIDPTAIIGPFCVVGADVKIGPETELVSHVVIAGKTTIGARNRIFPFASLGQPPQDLKFRGEKTALTIGDDNTIREYVTMNPGTEGGGAVTRIGSHNLFMALAHVAHDCQIGDHCVFANNATLAGHVQVGDNAILGGLSAVHQFVRIGRNAIVGGASGVAFDVIPFGSVLGNRATLRGLNLVGLKRQGFPREVIHKLRQAYRMMFAEEGSMADRVSDVAELFKEIPEVMEVTTFVAGSKRGICLPNGAEDKSAGEAND